MREYCAFGEGSPLSLSVRERARDLENESFFSATASLILRFATPKSASYRQTPNSSKFLLSYG